MDIKKALDNLLAAGKITKKQYTAAVAKLK